MQKYMRIISDFEINSRIVRASVTRYQIWIIKWIAWRRKWFAIRDNRYCNSHANIAYTHRTASFLHINEREKVELPLTVESIGCKKFVTFTLARVHKFTLFAIPPVFAHRRFRCNTSVCDRADREVAHQSWSGCLVSSATLACKYLVAINRGARKRVNIDASIAKWGTAVPAFIAGDDSTRPFAAVEHIYT